ncbi:hypothetical protein ASPCAL10701 [Aspergillus calidoustus]|uniref:UBC core domain-containing protein n=1 Tax=Aspergillus calidoustus TaxID=454130 RepID=A0A0U5GAV7_ASPCI|nr:hypothetical protein ASPCAL10701 [Aspergillus calidoustus]
MLGMAVKRHMDDTTTGIIISSTLSCTLEPIAFQPIDPITGEYLPVKLTQKLFGDRDDFMTPEESNTEASPTLLFDVPKSELTGYEEFAEDDFIVYRQKLGVIRAIEHDAVLLLPNSEVVSPLSTAALELPLCADPKVTISMPETKCRDLGNGQVVRTMYTEDIQPGQSVLIDPLNLYRNKLSAEYRGRSIRAHMLAAPIEDIHIDWLCPNVFSSKPQECGPNREVLRLSTLQGNAVKCDFAQPSGEESLASGCESMLAIGERVRFRDPADAATKYPGYQHLPSDQTFGHDLNIFRIASTKTEAVVRWQDGSCTTEASISLRRYHAPEDHLWPGKYVVLKDGVVTVTESPPGPSHSRATDTLRVQKVGVVQAVDNREQIASVRWYRNPRVELICKGSALGPHSSLGHLEETTTTVSVYELATFPAFNRSLNDLVILAPSTIDQTAISPSHEQESIISSPTKSFTHNTFLRYAHYLHSIKSAMVESEWFKKTTTIRAPRLRRRYSIQSDESTLSVHFVGKIVAMDLNGEITVRLPGHNSCRDIRVPLERIMMVIPSDDQIPNDSLISPYEGNLDENSSDSEWDTEDESDGSLNSEELTSPSRATDIGSLEEVTTTSKPEFQFDRSQLPSERVPVAGDTSTPIVYITAPTSCPPNFAVLEDPPPSNHYFITRTYSGSLRTCMKRLQKEYEVLQSSLPSGIFVRTWESRMNLMRVMMIGPEGTPYEHAPFVIDFCFTPDFSRQPPLAFFHSWTDGQGRINPNLYEDGKICLSILGTWPTRNPDESWIPGKSTVLQILVSIMGLVLVKAPFYNEAGYELLASEDNKRVESLQYTERAFIMTRKFILQALQNPICGLTDVLFWHYLPDSSSNRPQLLKRVIKEAVQMIQHSSSTSPNGDCQKPMASEFLPRLSLGAVVMLKRHVAALQKLESNVQSSQSPQITG